jgi:hypothetical protein
MNGPRNSTDDGGCRREHNKREEEHKRVTEKLTIEKRQKNVPKKKTRSNINDNAKKKKAGRHRTHGHIFHQKPVLMRPLST